jgi:hypothetical protein
MQMYNIQLGRSGPNGFILMETARLVVSGGRDELEWRVVDLLRTRGTQIGAKVARVMGDNGKVLWEFP